MAKNQDLSRYQKGIVRRFYDHRDGQVAMTLQEILSDIALAPPGTPAAAKHWKRLGEWLPKAGVEPARAAALVEGKNLKLAAEIVGKLK